MNFYELSPEVVIEILRKAQKKNNYFRFGEYQHLLVVDPRLSINALDEDEEEDLVLMNFFQILFGLLGNVDVGNVVDLAGVVQTYRTSGDVNTGYKTYIRTGTSTTPETLQDYMLGGTVVARTTTSVYQLFSDKFRLVWEALFNDTISEFGVTFEGYNTAGTLRSVLLTRKVIGTTTVNGLRVFLDITNPFNKNFGMILYGTFWDANVDGVVDITGGTFQARTANDYNAGSLKLGVDPNDVSWSIDLVTTPSPTLLTTLTCVYTTRTLSYLLSVAYVSPSSDIQVSTILLDQPIYDSGGYVHETLLGILKPPSPITLYANRTNILAVLFAVS